LSGFSFCIYDQARQKHVMLKGFSVNEPDFDIWCGKFDEFLLQIPVSSIPVNCLFVSPKHTFIPADAFDATKLKQYLSFFTPLDDLDEIHYTLVPLINGYCCFAMPNYVVTTLFQRFGKVRFFSQAYQNLMQVSGKQHKNKIGMMFCNNFMEITVFKDNKFVLNNSYEIANGYDIIYFIAALNNVLDLSHPTIYTSGETFIASSNTDLVGCLQSYFPNLVQNVNRRIALLLGSDISTKYYNLLSLHECE
jgi:hypothetical protein